jgi:CBS-domain-containing membrane protein
VKKAISLLLLIFGLLVLGCVEKQPETKKETPVETPTATPTPTPTPKPEVEIDVNLTDVDQLLNDLQELENIDFNI